MGESRIAINDQLLTESELRTLQMALGALELQLNSGISDMDVPISGAADHLKNIARLHRLVGELGDSL